MTYTKKVIGLTGNTGSGKTTICRILEEHNAYILNADTLAHKVLSGEASHDVLCAFGTICRKELGRIVFADESKRKKLESIIHPYVVNEIKAKINELQTSQNAYAYIVIDAPLLIEAKLHLLADTTWVVSADEEHRLNRIMARDNISKQEAQARMSSQKAFCELAPYAHVILENNGDLASLKEQVQQALGRRI